MRLKSRIEKMEQSSGAQGWVAKVLYIGFQSPSPTGPQSGGVQMAMLVGMGAGYLKRNLGESESAFHARVDAWADSRRANHVAH